MVGVVVAGGGPAQGAEAVRTAIGVRGILAAAPVRAEVAAPALTLAAGRVLPAAVDPLLRVLPGAAVDAASGAVPSAA